MTAVLPRNPRDVPSPEKHKITGKFGISMT